jgi:hypothetical protein
MTSFSTLSLTSPLPAAAAAAIVTPPPTSDMMWPLGKVAFSLLPLAGTYTRRATVEETIVPDTIWTHDQIQGIVNVNVPVRMTTIKLKTGGLWIHNPVAPTPQLLEMIHQLAAPVEHIVLGTVALEHKATFGDFCSHFPKATVWIQPGQWSFPVQLPISTLGVQQRGKLLRELPVANQRVTRGSSRSTIKSPDVALPPWSDEIEYEVLGPLKFKSVGAFSETAFFHKATKSLIVTDTVVSVTKDAPPIIQEDPRAMFHARDSIHDIVEDTPEARQKGWRRMVQFGLVFFPSQIDVVPFGQAIKEASKVDASMKSLGDGGVPLSLYPWTWKDGSADQVNFDAISRGGTLFCPPILTKIILDREPQRTIAWVDRVVERFDFQRVIPGHLNNNVKATPREFSEAFSVLGGTQLPQRPLTEDLSLLQKASDLLTKYGVVSPSLVCDGEPARTIGRFAKK